MDDETTTASGGSPDDGPVSKKEQIVALYLSGMNDVVVLSDSSPSYVGKVLQDEGLVAEYFDLYTSTSRPMNVYSKFFAGRLGFKDVERARESAALIDQVDDPFRVARDRAGLMPGSCLCARLLLLYAQCVCGGNGKSTVPAGCRMARCGYRVAAAARLYSEDEALWYAAEPGRHVRWIRKRMKGAVHFDTPKARDVLCPRTARLRPLGRESPFPPRIAPSRRSDLYHRQELLC